MPQSLRDDLPDSEHPHVVVEGRTAEEALEEVHRIHGTDARIVQAEKVRKGGVGGFFTRELVQLTVDTGTHAPGVDDVAEPLFPQGTLAQGAPAPVATPAASSEEERNARRRTPVPPPRRVASTRRVAATDASPPPVAPFPAAPAASATPPTPTSGIDAIVAGLAADTDRRESTFGDALRAALEDRGTTPAPDPAPEQAAAREPAPTFDDRGDVFSPRPRDAVFASGATALAATAERVEAPPRVLPAIEDGEVVHAAREARLRRDRVTDELEAAETRLDAAVRAATAGTTARTVLRAAESGAPSGLAAPIAPTFEQAQVAAAPVSAASTPPVTSQAVPTGRWSEDRLARLGVPAVLVRTIVGQRPKDDLGWLTATARAVAPLVGPAPAGPGLLVGRVRDHAAALDVTVCSQSMRPPHSGTVALAGQPTDQVRRWLDRELGARWLHLVVGGGRWRDWLFEQPAAVAWDRPSDLPDALSVAAQFDLPLTGTVVAGEWHAADPTDIAIALRTLLEQR